MAAVTHTYYVFSSAVNILIINNSPVQLDPFVQTSVEAFIMNVVLKSAVSATWLLVWTNLNDLRGMPGIVRSLYQKMVTNVGQILTLLTIFAAVVVGFFLLRRHFRGHSKEVLFRTTTFTTTFAIHTIAVFIA